MKEFNPVAAYINGAIARGLGRGVEPIRPCYTEPADEEWFENRQFVDFGLEQEFKDTIPVDIKKLKSKEQKITESLRRY